MKPDTVTGPLERIVGRHTPGPWSVGHTTRSRTHPSLPTCYETAVHVGDTSDRGNCLAIVYLGGPGALRSDPEHVEANARLIAAAPELLEAAQKALHYMRLHKYADQAWTDDLEAAIAKALGVPPNVKVEPTQGRQEKPR